MTKIPYFLLCALCGTEMAESAPRPAPSLPAPLAERLLHLDAAYPEWELPDGSYNFSWSEGKGYWVLYREQDTLYSPPIAWEGELSPGLYSSLRALSEDARVSSKRPRRLLGWTLAGGSLLALAALSLCQGPQKSIRRQELSP